MRQSYRNRYNIMVANGILPLTVPVVKPLKNMTHTKDALVSYDTPWQTNHWRSIVSAYGRTPFFEFYADDYEPHFNKQYKYLWDYNLSLMSVVADQLGISSDIVFTNNYDGVLLDGCDLRDMIHPKRDWQEDTSFFPQSYHQVFDDKRGFCPNLSIIDMIFNVGPDSAQLLRNCILEKI